MRAGAFLGVSLIVAPHDGRNIVQISSREQLVFPAQAILVFASRPISVTHRPSPHVRDPSFETVGKNPPNPPEETHHRHFGRSAFFQNRVGRLLAITVKMSGALLRTPAARSMN